MNLRSITEREGWTEAIKTAKKEYRNRKMTLATAEKDYKPDSEELGAVVPVFVPNTRVTMCQQCGDKFSLLVRHHHCRACGKVFCAACCASRAPVKYKQFEAVRVCNKCCQALLKSKFNTLLTNQSTHTFRILQPHRAYISVQGKARVHVPTKI